MSELKIILCVIIGGLIANSISYFAYKEIEKNIHSEENENSTESKAKESKNYIEPPKLGINIIIKNNSTNKLSCVDKNVNNFLNLHWSESKNYIDMEKNAFIGCNIVIDDRSTTILNWFHITLPGVYQLSMESTYCDKCPTKQRWATIVTKPNGERGYDQFWEK